MENFLKQIISRLDLIVNALNNPWQILAVLASVIAAVAAWFTVIQVRETEKDRELPILIPYGSNNLSEKDQEFKFTLKNIGRGVPKDFYIYIDKYKVRVFGGNSNIRADEKENFHSNDHIVQIKKLLKKNPQKVKMKFEYKDVHERNFKTINMEYTQEDKKDKTYSLNPKIWKFKRLKYAIFF